MSSRNCLPTGSACFSPLGSARDPGGRFARRRRWFALSPLLVMLLAGFASANDSTTPAPSAETAAPPSASPSPTPEAPAQVEEESVRKAAVALNYCRSAFFRIEKDPSAAVLAQEREKILNNLDLTNIEDEAIVKLYTATLDEITSIRIADKEEKVVNKGFGKSWQSLATMTAFGFLTDVSEFNYASAVRRGATSWWDFRGIQVNRDMELWKVEKGRMSAVQAKSSSFLEASWKLAHTRKVPDRWLVRNSEFERLYTAMQEQDLNVRLRLLERMSPFMECYPPYWYYVARTQQQLGQFPQAEQTYRNVERLGDGHFRRDDMLAATMANVASIRDYLKLPGAPAAAEKALAYTTDAWEVNLMAGAVLMRNGRIAQAEDAVLRNLDSGLESEQSSVALLAVYATEGDPNKILARLNDGALVYRTPIPILLRCAAHLEGQRLPRVVAERLQSTLQAYQQQDSLILVADPAWNLRGALFAMDEDAGQPPRMHVTDRGVMVRFPHAAPATAEEASSGVTVELKYNADFTVKLALQPSPYPSPAPRARWGNYMRFQAGREQTPQAPSLRLASVETKNAVIALNGAIRGSTSDGLAKPGDPSLANNGPSDAPPWQGLSVQPAALESTIHSTAKPVAPEGGLGLPLSTTDQAPVADYPRPGQNETPEFDTMPTSVMQSDTLATSNLAGENGVTLGSPEPLLEPLPPLVEPFP